MKINDSPENNKTKRFLSALKVPFKFLWCPLIYFPNYGINARHHFLSFAFLANIGAAIVFIVKYYKYGYIIAWERARVWLIVAAIAYAIGTALKFLHAINFHLQHIRKDLDELKKKNNEDVEDSKESGIDS